MRKSNIKLAILTIIAVLFLGSCAETWNTADNRGGLFFSSKADYIVLSQSGGMVMDVYKLKNVIVSSPSGSDGWIFKDQSGNSINLGGDVKVKRCNESTSDWAKYIEYHMEFETITYREKLKKVIEHRLGNPEGFIDY